MSTEPSTSPSRQQLTNDALVLMHVPGVKLVSERPAGYRQMQLIAAVSEKAIRFHYYGWLLWVPKRATVQIRNKREFWAAAWAVDSAKDSGFAERAS